MSRNPTQRTDVLSHLVKTENSLDKARRQAIRSMAYKMARQLALDIVRHPLFVRRGA